jgi:hypothetical protein
MSNVNFPEYPLFEDIGGETYLLAENKNPKWSIFNPSIGVDEHGNYAIVFKSSNFKLSFPEYYINITEGSDIKNRAYFSEIDSDFKTLKNFSEVTIVGLPFPSKRGVEDLRLFWRNNSWWMLGVIYEPGFINMYILGLFKYNKKSKEATFIKTFKSPYGEHCPEKNWMLPYKENSNFDFVYSCGKTIKDDIIISDQGISKLNFRGGSCLLDLGDKTYLAIVHKNFEAQYSWYQADISSVWDGVIRNYVHCFVRYDWNGRIIQYTDPFQFLSPGIEFAAGLVEHGKDLVISFGKQDSSSYIAKISKEKVLSLLKDLPNE